MCVVHVNESLSGSVQLSLTLSVIPTNYGGFAAPTRQPGKRRRVCRGFYALYRYVSMSGSYTKVLVNPDPQIETQKMHIFICNRIQL